MKDNFRIGVFMLAQGQWQRAGVLSVGAGRGTAFAYTPEYAGPPLAPDLDYRTGPRSFVMAASTDVRASRRKDLFRIFQECLPGEWGERVLVGDPKFGAAFQMNSPAQRLYMLGHRKVGALYFQPEGIPVEQDEDLPVIGTAALAKMERAAEDYLSALSSRIGGDRERWCLTSNGGRQPKAAYKDKNNIEYVAKFTQEVDGSYELPRVEAAMLATSRASGLSTADGTLEELGGRGRTALLSRRFDRDMVTIGDKQVAHVRHKVSMEVVMFGSDPSTEQAQVDYVDLAVWLRANSADPETDVKDLYGRMVLNAYANNIDDHLGNIEVMQDDKYGWRLAPNFDLLIGDSMDEGQPRRVHRTTMGGLETPPYEPEFLARIADDMGLSEIDGLEIVNRVLTNIEALPDRLVNFGCSNATLERVLPALQLDQVGDLRMRIAEALEAERDKTAVAEEQTM